MSQYARIRPITDNEATVVVAIDAIQAPSEHPINLTLSQIEPLVIPKQTLTGETQERTDTRVLQVIFEVAAGKRAQPIYVGQQMDVFAIKQ